MTTVLYNCTRCKVGRRVEYSAGKESSAGRRWSYRLDDAGRRQFPGAFMQQRGQDGTCTYGGDPLGMCEGCGKPMRWGALQTYPRPEVKCNAICTNARGFQCECSCSGKNHGTGWGFTALLGK